MQELNDVYDKERNKTGAVHLRGKPWRRGEYGLAVCVWIYDGKGKLLLTKRDMAKSFGGTWENTGGSVIAGETSLQAIVRETFEETGIRAAEGDFEKIGSTTHRHMHFDHYCLKRTDPIEAIILQPGETVDTKWLTFSEVEDIIRKKEMCKVITRQYLRFADVLKKRSGHPGA